LAICNVLKVCDRQILEIRVEEVGKISVEEGVAEFVGCHDLLEVSGLTTNNG
jgi:hypothetical protein